MSKNICFVANYYKTDIFIKIAKGLETQGIQAFFIIPSKKQYVELSELYTSDKLLYIGKKEVLASSNNPETTYDLKIHELIYGDRVLRLESEKWTYDYLLKLQPLYYDFIKRNDIRFIFGEITWSHELVAQRITKQAKELNCEYLIPQTIRIPNGYFAFFKDDFESQIKETSDNLTPQPIIEAVKPAYLAIMDKQIRKNGSLKGNIKKLKNFITRTNQDSNDPTLYSNPYHQFQVRSLEIYNRFEFRSFVKETTYDELPKDKKFILFTLHKQPEASIDVIGRYYENQLNLIKNIWRVLPEGYILLVKEHSNAIGDRGLKFYKTVKSLRNTILIHHKEDSHRLIDLCDAIFTVSGTIAYETALKGKRSFTFSPAFFNRLSNCSEISWKDFRNAESFFDLIQEKEPNNRQEFSNWLLNNSFKGIMTDAYTEPACVEDENIDKLCAGFLSVINKEIETH